MLSGRWGEVMYTTEISIIYELFLSDENVWKLIISSIILFNFPSFLLPTNAPFPWLCAERRISKCTQKSNNFQWPNNVEIGIENASCFSGCRKLLKKMNRKIAITALVLRVNWLTNTITSKPAPVSLLFFCHFLISLCRRHPWKSIDFSSPYSRHEYIDSLFLVKCNLFLLPSKTSTHARLIRSCGIRGITEILYLLRSRNQLLLRCEFCCEEKCFGPNCNTRISSHDYV